MLPDQLGTNEVLKPGQSKVSNGGKVKLTMLSTGNLVLAQVSPPKILWASGTAGKGALEAYMGFDGNLAVRKLNNGPAVWNSNTGGYKNAHAIVQNDGNLVVFKDNRIDAGSAVWETRTNGFKQGSLLGQGLTHDVHGKGLGPFLSNAIKSAGRAVGSAVHVVSSASGAISNAVSKVPFIGPALHALYGLETGPFNLALSVASGQRIDRALLSSAKEQFADVKEIAPYAQMVIAVVPGVGPGVSGAISAGLAVASGQSISEALIAGVKGSIPGGALAQAAFDVGKAAVEGKDIASIGVAALPIPDVAKQALSTGLQVTQKLVSGQRVDKTLIDAGMKYLPPAGQSAVRAVEGIAGGKNVAETLSNELQKALPLPAAVKTAMNVGVAISQGKKLQDIATSQIPTLLPKLGDIGNKVLDPVVQAARKLVPEGVKGFDIGIGLMAHQIGVHDFQSIRNKLSPGDKKAFDMATSLHVGRVAHTPPKNLASPAGLVGFYASKGMMGAPPSNKVALMKVIVPNPEMAAGAKVAIISVANARSRTWWQKFIEMFGFKAAA